MYFLCLYRCRCTSGADRPDRLVSNQPRRKSLDAHDIKHCPQLSAHDIQGSCRITLSQCLAYAQNWCEPTSQGCSNFGSNQNIRLAIQGPAL